MEKKKYLVAFSVFVSLYTDPREVRGLQAIKRGGFIVFVDADLAIGAAAKSEATLLLCNVDVNN